MSPPPPAVSEPAAPPLEVRERERYEVLAEHGRGGLGRVSRARDKQLGRDVAIKELIKRGDASEVRFVREALITARLEHPGVVPVHEAGCWDDGTPFYAMKLVSGRPLKQLIEERTTVEARLALLPHVIAVADAIAYAHGRRIIHRDLKPSNVIVGEFGETVVIDWGLAKDLSSDDEPALDPAVQRGSPSSDLTATGSVLGTPAYMAPEQARGGPVDERVDVFAIGAMLWELCMRTRVPDDGHRRHALLRGAGVDRDLATIVTTAIAPEPRDRYPNAAALAADLKAFLAGARIASRNYSLPAMLAHWARRHRRLAIAAVAVAAVALGGAIAYVHNIAAERDRADASASEARTQQHRAEQIAGELALQHAELQMRSDPTGAIATLAGYRGGDASQLRRLRAEAIGRGVASASAKPHTDLVWFVASDPHGGVLSIGRERTLQRTRGGTSTTLATNLASPPVGAYAREGELFVYAPVPSGLVALSLATGATTPIDTPTPKAVELLPDGSRLAALTGDGTLTVWSLQPTLQVLHRATLEGARSLAFATPERLVVRDAAGLRTLELGSARSASIALPVRSYDVDAARVVVGDGEGGVALMSADLDVLAKRPVCHSAVTAQLVPHGELIAFACGEGLAGVARFDRAAGALVVVDTFATAERAFGVAPDASGTRVAFAEDSSVIYVYDIETRLVTRFEGQPASINTLTAPAAGFDHFAAGDFGGNLRVWDPPRRDARKVLQTPGAVFGVAFSPDGRSLATNNIDGTVRVVRIADGVVTELRGHTTGVMRVLFSPDGRFVVSYSSDGTARAWRTDGTPTRVLADHARPVNGISFLEAGRRVVTVGDDGRLLAWSPDGSDVAELYKSTTPLTGVEVLSPSDHAIVRDASGALWDVAPGGAVHQVRTGDGATVSVLRASPDGTLLAAGTDRGNITVYETAGWTKVLTTELGAGVRQIKIDPRNRDLAVVTHDGRVHAIALGPARTLHVRDVAIGARSIEYSPDGELLAMVCGNGGTWLYDLRSDTWAYGAEHTAEVFSGAFSPDGALFASGDRRGIVTIRNVAATLVAAPATP